MIAAGCGNGSAGNSTAASGGNGTDSARAKAVKFAECMRNNGVSAFPDPTPNGPIIDVNGAHSIPGFQTALQKCSAIYASMGLQGR